MASGSKSSIRVGIGGWNFDEWRGPFYPPGLSQKRELEYASRKLSSIEINSTFYGAQKPESFARWREETPGGFVFAVKGPRFATNRRVLAEAGPSIERFFTGGVMKLKEKLGPVNWQFAGTKAFDPADFAAFLKLLPKTVEGLPVRHAIEARHASFAAPEAFALAREHDVSFVDAGDSKYPRIEDRDAPFVYTRIMGTTEGEPLGYGAAALDAWAAHAKAKAAGRDVFLYVISGFKARNPLAAMALIERLGG